MIKDVMEMNWTDFDLLDKNKATVFLGFAPIEEHGRHLPLGVDMYETQYWIKHTVEKLAHELADHTFIKIPVIPYGHATMKGFPGNMHLSQRTFYQLVLETLEAVVEWGIPNIVVISGHADVRHTLAIEQACEQIKRKMGVEIFAPMGAIFSGIVGDVPGQTKVTRDMSAFRNDFHAGWLETSNMLVIRPDLVRDNYKEQPAITMCGRDMANPDLVAEKIRGYGHIGYPKEASQTLGKELLASSVDQIVYCVTAYLKRQGYESFMHHRLYQLEALRVKEDENV